MGFEWHDRQRDRGGRFAAHLRRAHQQQLHIRVSDDLGDLIRAHALEAGEELGEYLVRAAAMRIKAEGAQPIDG